MTNETKRASETHWTASGYRATVFTLLATASVLMLLQTGHAADAKAGTQAWLPKELKLHWEDPSPKAEMSSVTFEWDGVALKYDVTRPASSKGLKSDHRVVKPTEAAWREFWLSIESNNIWNWSSDYGQRPAASENWQWTMAIELGSKKVKAKGRNSYPDLGDERKPGAHSAHLHRLWHAADRLAAVEIEVEGTYLAGFETSRLTPSSKEFAGQRWWLQSTEDFNQRYKALSPKEEGGPRLAGPEVFVRLRGRLTGPGRYGHLNSYDHEFDVTEMLEMKRAK
jgi:hypothetical protein